MAFLGYTSTLEQRPARLPAGSETTLNFWRGGLLRKKLIPNFFIVGTPKAGTTSFADYLGQHPEVYMSPVKEPRYFSSDIPDRFQGVKIKPEEYFATRPLAKMHGLCIHRPEHYEQLFAEAGNARAVGEASVNYLYSQVAPRRISEEIADPRILIFLRNPIERAYSHFQMDVTFGVAATSDFVKAVEMDFASPDKDTAHWYIEHGRYVPQLKRYLERFPAERVKISFHDDYRSDARETLLDILSFLGVERSLRNISLERRGEAQRAPAFPGLQTTLQGSWPYRLVRHAIPRDLRAKTKKLLSRRPKRLQRSEFEALIPYFREDVLELSSLLGRDLTHWLRPRAEP